MVDKLHLTPSLLKFLEQEHLMHIFTSQPRWFRQNDPIKGGLPDLFAQAIQSGTTQARSTVAIISKNGRFSPVPFLALTVLLEPIELLVDRLGLCLVLGRNTYIHGNSHWDSPERVAPPCPIGPMTGNSGPIGIARRRSSLCNVEWSIAVSS